MERNRMLPWLGMIQDSWSGYQQQADVAAHLTAIITKVGFYSHCYPFNQLANKMVTEQIKYIGSELVCEESAAEDIDSFMTELVEMIDKKTYYSKLKDELCKQIRSYRDMMNQDRYQINHNVINIINFNLYQIRHNTDVLDLVNITDREHLSIEYLYSYLIGYYKTEIFNHCPQLLFYTCTVPFVKLHEQHHRQFLKNVDQNQPKRRKLVQFVAKIKQMGNWAHLFQGNDIDKLDYDELVDILHKSIDQKIYGMSTRKKMKKLLKYLKDDHLINKRSINYREESYNVRIEIKSLSSMVSKHDQSDTEIQQQKEDIAYLFYQVLQFCLNKQVSDIQIQNMNTLRAAHRHVVYEFLKSKSPRLQKQDSDFNEIQQEIQQENDKMKYLALLVRRTKKIELFKSDWQNNIAKVWAKQKARIIHLYKKQQQFIENNIQKEGVKDIQQLKVQIPPPIQFELAIDLFPQAQPFAFTYGRKGGYCLDYQNCKSYFLNEANYQEKQYFKHILLNPPEKLAFLKEINPKLVSLDDKNEKFMVNDIDDWLNSNPHSEVASKVKKYTCDYKMNQLPGFLSKKVWEDKNVKWVSTVALFNSIFYHYPSEELYLDGVELPLPGTNFQEKKIQQKGFEDAEKQKYSKWKWPPVGYGGFR